MTLLEKFAEAIRQHEGFYKGSRSWRNNNPGNLKFASQPGAVGQDAGGFAVFNTYEDGWNALIELISRAATGNSSVYYPEMTILQFFQKYAPSADNNNPLAYASIVAEYIGKDTKFKIKNLMEIKPDNMIVDEKLLVKLYQLVFKRMPDADAVGYLGKDINEVLDFLLMSNENLAYTEVYKAVKNIEKNL